MNHRAIGRQTSRDTPSPPCEPASQRNADVAARLHQDSAAWGAQLALLAWIVVAWLASRSVTSLDTVDAARHSPTHDEQVDAAGL